MNTATFTAVRTMLTHMSAIDTFNGFESMANPFSSPPCYGICRN